MPTCLKCGKGLGAGASSCSACGDAPSLGLAPAGWRDEPRGREIRGGRGPLLAVAVLQVISSLILANAGDPSDGREALESMRAAAGINLGVGALFFALWAWAKSSPLAASVSGLVVFLGTQIVAMVQSPVAFLFRIVADLIILAFLIRSVMAARAAIEWDKQEGGPKRAEGRTVEDPYAVVKEIEQRLAALGLEEWKTRLEDAALGGATSGEILMALRWHLKELRKDKPGLPPDLGRLIDRAIQLINRSGV